MIDEASSKSNGIPVVIRGSLELLTRFEPADDFSYRLWRAAAAIDYFQRATGSEAMTRLLDGMIDLCALLPKTDEANYQGEFLRATVLIRRKKPDAAGAILAELRDRPGLPDDTRRTGFLNAGRQRRHRGMTTTPRLQTGKRWTIFPRTRSLFSHC